MESRRAKRGGGGGGGGDVADPIKSSPKSVGRAASKSPSRRSSPARNRSPGRATTKSSAAATATAAANALTQRRSARNRNESKANDNDTASETDDSKSDIGQGKPVMKLRLSPLKLDKLPSVEKKSGSASRTITKNSVTVTTSESSVKVSNITNEGDDEVARLTAKYLQSATDKLNANSNIGSTNNLTPSVSELSTGGKRSYSRSVSHSVLDDEEWSHSDHSEKGDNQLYANRITRSRSKTHGNYLLRREQSLANDSAAEFGGSIAVSILVLLVSALAFCVQYVCSRPECSCKALRVEKLKLLSTYVSLDSAYLYIGFAWLVSLLSAIPYLGHKKQLPPSASNIEQTATQHYFNGLASALLIVGGLGTAEYYFKYPILALIYKNYQQLCLVSIVYAIIISVWCFVRSTYFPAREWNPYAKCGRLFSDLFIGREISPRWFNVIDIKLTHLRISLISTLIFNLILLARNIKFAALPVPGPNQAALNVTDIGLHLIQNVKYDPIAATISLLIVISILDALIFEHHLTSSFELQCEGVGTQLLLRYALYPIWTSLIAKYALQNKITGVPNWLLAIVVVAYLSGLVLKRLSNELKYHYRAYPNSSRSLSEYYTQFHFIFSVCKMRLLTISSLTLPLPTKNWKHCQRSKDAVY